MQPPKNLELNQADSSTVTIDTQLPTPPNEETDYAPVGLRLPSIADIPSGSDLGLMHDDPWNIRSSGAGSTAGSSIPSPPTAFDDPPPDFDDYPYSNGNSEAFIISNQSYDFPDPSNKASPTSSNEVELDTDLDIDETEEEEGWNSSFERLDTFITDDPGLPEGMKVQKITGTWSPVSDKASPRRSHHDSFLDDSDPFSDSNVQKDEVQTATKTEDTTTATTTK